MLNGIRVPIISTNLSPAERKLADIVAEEAYERASSGSGFYLAGRPLPKKERPSVIPQVEEKNS